MKKLVLPLLLSTLLFGCTNNANDKEETFETTVESTIISTESSETIEVEPLIIKETSYDLNEKTFSIVGSVDKSNTLTMSVSDQNKKSIEISDSGSWIFTDTIPENETDYVFTDGITSETIKIDSLSNLMKIEAKKQEEIEKQKQVDEEEKIRKEKEAAEREEAEKQKKAEEAEKRSQEEAINNATREQKNALSKAIDYLDYSAFSKSGLYEQLIYEQFPEEAAQFAVDNVQADWNEQALNKALDYLDYSSFSDAGLYDQLVFEGFTSEQAQYAIDNLPN
ncbi:Ltp family lipoprotein [Vagococcus zengguangii]|nr:Ltp family lipoprotein [Vagococcus zengguangii]